MCLMLRIGKKNISYFIQLKVWQANFFILFDLGRFILKKGIICYFYVSAYTVFV